MDRFIVLNKPNPHLPHDSVELQSPPPPDALTDEIARKNAELIVSRLMRGGSGDDHDRPAATRSGPGADLADTSALPASDAAAPAALPAQASLPAPVPTTPPPRPVAGRATTQEAALRAALLDGCEIDPADDGRGALFGRLHPVHAVLAAGLLAALLWPVVVAGLVLALLGLALGAAALLRRAVAAGRWQRFARHHPRVAERLRRAADRAAERIDRMTDPLPTALAERLTWSDLSQTPNAAAPAMPSGMRRA